MLGSHDRLLMSLPFPASLSSKVPPLMVRPPVKLLKVPGPAKPVVLFKVSVPAPFLTSAKVPVLEKLSRMMPVKVKSLPAVSVVPLE